MRSDIQAMNARTGEWTELLLLLHVYTCDWIYGNHKLEVTRKSIVKILKHYNQPGIVSWQTKLTQKVDHFIVFESFPSTNCCSNKFMPNKKEKFGWLDMQGSIRDV